MRASGNNSSDRVPESLRALAADLSGDISGEVRFDEWTRMLYSTDASIFQIMPLGVVFPKNEEEVIAVVERCAGYGLPVLPRGGGTSLAGQTVNEAVVLDLNRHLGAITRFHPESGSITAQPGIYLDHLNTAVAGSNLMFGPDPASGNRATIGGVLGNNGTGSHSILYGMSGDHLKRVRTVLADGSRAVFESVSWEEAHRRAGLAPPGDIEGSEGGVKAAPPPVSLEMAIYREIVKIVRDRQPVIEAGFSKHWRRVGGYDLKGFRPGRPINLARLMAGSEGTLGIMVELELGLVEKPPGTSLAVLAYDSLLSALGTVPALLAGSPSAVELMDSMLLGLTRLQPEYARRMTFVEGEPEALFMVEVYGESEGERESHLELLIAAAREAADGPVGARILHDPAAQANVWSVRKAGLGLVMSKRGDLKPLPFIEDTAVLPENLRDYIGEVLRVLRDHDAPATFYAHASAGCLHIRPIVNLKEGAGIAKMASISEAVSDLVLKYGGVMSGEHGDGILRSALSPKIHGEDLHALFERVKDTFDPEGIMNPGRIVRGPSLTESLRYGEEYSTIPVTTWFDFTADGGFARAVEMCNGSGECRKLDSGTMCPSFMATRDEEHSTRGRGNALRAVLSGRIESAGLLDERLYQTLDLCLECKACTTECPSTVDMTRLKTEFLAHWHREHGVPLRTRMIGGIDRLNRLGSATAPFSNWIVGSLPARWLLDRLVGLEARRSLPRFHRQTLEKRFRREPHRSDSATDGRPERGTVLLLPDGFTNYTEPEIGMDAVRLLRGLGWRVELLPLPGGTCGRAPLSKGLLDRAVAAIRTNLEAWAPLIEGGYPILGVEPSSLLSLRDEYPALVPGEVAERVAASARLIEEWLVEQEGELGPALQFRTPRDHDEARLLVHGHCHQKALAGSDPLMRALGWLPGTEVEEIDAGCCGMAGSFGYEKEHYDLSMKIGGERLFPAIEALHGRGTILAPGTSCRHHIADATGRKALHPVEVLAARLIHSSSGAPTRGTRSTKGQSG